MRFIIPVFIILFVSQSWGESYGTYKDIHGKTKKIKNIDGKIHSYKGRIEPGADLQGADLSGANLYRANLRGVDLTGANLSRAYLRNANLNGTVLNRTDFQGADIGFAIISRIGFVRHEYHQSDFRLANLSGTVFIHAVGWGKANWQGAHFDEKHPPVLPPAIVPADYGIVCDTGNLNKNKTNNQ